MVKVPVVEGEAVTSHLLIHQLEDKGCQARKVDNGAMALQRIKEDTPDIIFVDTVMPAMDGMFFLSELRENPETSKIPVVMVTATNLSGVIPRARELGIKHVLPNPGSRSRWTER
ncbi:MAG: response regulator [Chloroflexi bacterium]|nr:response regulator [Chloroflexota bacterium]MDA1272310.1 response regulator [Chloroflexota bacterium]PKB58632.1 MAG: hypothetical protein BZY83_06150 [SAR202 cluster bacterium Casp-Chloro-G2]